MNRTKRAAAQSLLALCLFTTRAAEAPPAKVSAPVKEAELVQVSLTPEAENRLGITTAEAVVKKTSTTRFFGANVIPPQGDVSATNGSNTSVPTVWPTSSTELLRLAQSQVDADALVEQSKVQLESTTVALNRAEQVLKEKAGSVRNADDARAQKALAETAVRRAEAQRALLGPPLNLTTPQSSWWLRVPIYVGDLPRINQRAEALVGNLGGDVGQFQLRAKPVASPGPATVGTSTIDVFYTLTNPPAAIRLGQKLGVLLQLNEEQEGVTVPWSAVVFDIQGDAWVYENTGSHVYARRRIQLRSVTDGVATVASGLKPGIRVVTAGAAELFGTEFGAGK